jgi:hypothetical protein
MASAAGLAPAMTRVKGAALDYFAFADMCSHRFAMQMKNGGTRRACSPGATLALDVISNDSRHARPVHVPLVLPAGFAPALSGV